MPEMITTGVAATRIGGPVQGHHIRRLANLEKIPYTRAGATRLLRVADLPKIRKALIEAGYLPAEQPTAATA